MVKDSVELELENKEMCKNWREEMNTAHGSPDTLQELKVTHYRMTKEELAVQVAEKVWGWKWEPSDPVPSGNQWEWQGKWVSSCGNDEWYQYGCSELLNSWEGFGRTVEAMEKTSCPHLEKSGNGRWMAVFYPMDFKPIDSRKSRHINFCKEKSDFNNLIEATHRAALEALND